MDHCGVGDRVAAAEGVDRGIGDSVIGRVQLERRDVSIPKLDDPRLSEQADLIHALAVNDHRPPGPQRFQALGDPVEQLGVGDAHDLRLDAGRVRERPKNVEGGSEVEALANRLHEAHRWMELGGEHEADMGLADALGDDVRPRVDVDAEFIEHVGGATAARDSAVTMLGDIGTRAGRHEGGSRGDVERLDDGTARAARVDHVVDVSLHSYSMISQRLCQAGDLAGRRPLHPHHCEKGRDLDFRHLALEDRVLQGLCLLKGQVLAVQNDFQVLRDVCHVQLPTVSFRLTAI